MSDAWRVASLKSFEQVSVGMATDLLRVAAESASSALSVPRPTLVADDGRAVSRFVALPAPPDAGPTLRAAYSVPVESVTSETVFSLELEDGFVIALPRPSGGEARLVPTPAEADIAPPTLAGEERRSELERKLAELSEDLADARRELSELRADAELTRRTRSQLLRLRVESAQQGAELRAVRDLEALIPLDPRLADADERLAEARSRLTEAQDEATEAVARADAAARELAAERERSHELEARVATLEAEARGAAERLVQAEQHAEDPRLEELEMWSGELERRLADTTTQLDEARTVSRHDEAELNRLRAELAEAQAGGELPRSEAPDDTSPEDAGSTSATEAPDLEALTHEALAEADRRAADDLAERLSGEPG